PPARPRGGPWRGLEGRARGGGQSRFARPPRVDQRPRLPRSVRYRPCDFPPFRRASDCFDRPLIPTHFCACNRSVPASGTAAGNGREYPGKPGINLEGGPTPCKICANRQVIVELFPPGHRRALGLPDRPYIVEVGGGTDAPSLNYAPHPATGCG